MTNWKEQARAEYEADCKKRTFYHDGTPRRAFDDLPEMYQRTWAPRQETAARHSDNSITTHHNTSQRS